MSLVALAAVSWSAAGTAAAGSGFVYALRQVDTGTNQIHGFRLDALTGELTPLPNFPLASGGTGGGPPNPEHLAYDAANGRLYAVNQINVSLNNTLGAFGVDRGTGALTPLPFHPISLGAGSAPPPVSPVP